MMTWPEAGGRQGKSMDVLGGTTSLNGTGFGCVGFLWPRSENVTPPVSATRAAVGDYSRGRCSDHARLGRTWTKRKGKKGRVRNWSELTNGK